MGLQEQLSKLKNENRSRVSDDIKATQLADLDALAKSGIIEAAPQVGGRLKDFSLPNHKGEVVSLAALRKQGPVVISFYRGGWCPYCNLELRAYQAILPEIKANGATLVAITPELPDESLTTAERNELAFEVLTDRNSDYGREIGIVFTVSEAIRSIYKGFGIDLEKHNGKGQYDLPLAATFVVDTDGTIVLAGVNVDYTVRTEPADVLASLKTLKNNKS